MPATNVRGGQVLDHSVQRVDLDVSTVGQAVITKLIGGTGISLSATGADAGTGDVTASVVGVRTTFSNANYTVLATDRYVATTTTVFTASRTVTLPAANAVAAGTLIYIGDDGGSITSAFTLSIARAGTDTIHKQASSIVLASPFACIILESDGVGNWTTVSRSPAVKVTFLTSGVSYATTVGCKAMLVECVGGGGGGGGCVAGTASTCSAAAGGGGGGYAAKFIVNPAAIYTYAVGAGGGGAVAGGNAGTNGGATTFGSPSVCTAGGGNGGGAGAAANSVGLPYQGGVGGTGTVGDTLAAGGVGGLGLELGGTQGASGMGGNSLWGGGGNALTSGNTGPGTGLAGAGYGGGGSGGLSVSGNTTAQAGGAGTAGAIRVTEYF
jgi:hypothetical protein